MAVSNLEKKNIRYTCSELEMISILKDLLKVKDLFTVWKRDEAKKIIFQIDATILSINMGGEITLQLNDIDDFQTKGDIYIAAEGGQVVFKLDILYVSEMIVVCNLPIEMKYIDRRKSARKKIKKEKAQDFELSFQSKFESELNQPHRVVSELIDISDTGASFAISKETLTEMDTTKEIVLRSLSPRDSLSENTKAQIKNSRKYKPMTMGHEAIYAIGVQFK